VGRGFSPENVEIKKIKPTSSCIGIINFKKINLENKNISSVLRKLNNSILNLKEEQE
jgi:hypothetical protein